MNTFSSKRWPKRLAFTQKSLNCRLNCNNCYSTGKTKPTENSWFPIGHVQKQKQQQPTNQPNPTYLVPMEHAHSVAMSNLDAVLQWVTPELREQTLRFQCFFANDVITKRVYILNREPVVQSSSAIGLCSAIRYLVLRKHLPLRGWNLAVTCLVVALIKLVHCQFSPSKLENRLFPVLKQAV